MSVTMPVTFDAAENAPISCGRSRCRSSSASSWTRSMWPSASSSMVTTSAIDSRHGSSLEWCSYGPMNTTGRSAAGICSVKWKRSSSTDGMRRPNTPTSLAIAPVEPLPQNSTALLVGGAHAASDDLAGILAKARGLEPGAGGLRVSVGVERQHHIGDVVLDEGERAARCRVVGVDDRLRAERTVDHLRPADDGLPDGVDQPRGRRHLPRVPRVGRWPAQEGRAPFCETASRRRWPAGDQSGGARIGGRRAISRAATSDEWRGSSCGPHP